MKHGVKYATLALGAAGLFHLAALGVWPEIVPEKHGPASGTTVLEQSKLTPTQWRNLTRKEGIKVLSLVQILTAGPGVLNTFNIPSNWNNAANSVAMVAAGGGGACCNTPSFFGGTGGGGGEYRIITNLSLTPGGTCSYQIGAGGTGGNSNSGAVGAAGGNSWFNGTTFSGASIGAVGGSGGIVTTGSSGSGGAGGTGGHGGTGNAGGNGGGITVTGAAGGGGGGAGGPSGVGAAGGSSTEVSGGGGGGGANNGSAGSNDNATNGGNGGNGVGGGGGGAGGPASSSNGTGGNGTAGGGGGGGGASGPTAQGGNGGSDTAFGSAGCGGGGGGGAVSSSSSTTSAQGGAGGLYGGGGGAGGTWVQSNSPLVDGSSPGGAGAQGIIIVTYTPVQGPQPPNFALLTILSNSWLPPQPGPTMDRNAQPYQPVNLTPPVSGPTPTNPPFPGTKVPVQVQIWNIPPPPIPPIVGVHTKVPPSQPTNPTIFGLGITQAPKAVYVQWLPPPYPPYGGNQQPYVQEVLSPPISGPVAQNPPRTGSQGALLLDVLIPSWIPPPPQPPIVVRNLSPPIPGKPSPSTASLFVLFNQIVAAQNLTWCDFDLYTITLFNGQVLRYTTADFDINVLGTTFTSQSVRIDQGQSKVQAHWKIGFDVDTWTVVFMPRPVDPVTGAPFPDKIGSIPWAQAAHSGFFDAADFQVDRAWFSSMPTWPMPPAGAAPVGTKTIFAGKIAAVDVTDLTVIFTVNDYRDLFSISMPLHFFQGTCRHTLFDNGCNADGNMTRERFAQTGIASSSSTQANIVPSIRTNLLINSNAFNGWTKSGSATVTPNAGQSPDNTNDASLVQRGATSASFIEAPNVNITGVAGEFFTFSVSAKANTGNFMAFYFSDQGGDPNAIRVCFNLSTGTVSSSPSVGAGGVTNLSAEVTQDLDGFWRCSVTGQFTETVTAFRPALAARATSGTADGTDTSSTASIYVFGAQVEQASGPTPYIKTGATTVTVGLGNPGGSGTYTLGTILMTSGLNTGFSRTVSNWDGTNMRLIAPFPFTVSLGDTFSAAAGCDLQRTTCVAFGNINNFGGQPYIPAPESVS